jgi:hypothetical protein
VAGEAVIVGDQSARAALGALSAADATVRVTWQGVPTPRVARAARHALRQLGLRNQSEVVLLNPVRLNGVIVRPAAIDPIEPWLASSDVSRLGSCLPRACAVLDATRGRLPQVLTSAGVRLRVVGDAPLMSAVPLSFSPVDDNRPPVVVTEDSRGLARLPGLDGVYRTYSWVAPLSRAQLHSWQLGAFQSALQRAGATLQAGVSQFSLSAPYDGLASARAQASAAPRRLLLVAAGAVAVLALFVLLAAAGLRRDQMAEIERLRNAGARGWQCLAFAIAECGWLCAGALIVGAAIGAGAVAVLCEGAAEPTGLVLAHSLLTPVAGLALAGGWLAATILMSTLALASGPRMLDVIAVGAGCALVAGLLVNPQGGDTLAALLAPLVCVTASLVIFRLAGPVLRLAERSSRGGKVGTRLALIGLARAPALPAAAIAFIAASVGLGGFAIAYRSTLMRGAADQAADRVPLDVRIGPAANFTTPLELTPLSRWRELARGKVLAIRRTYASYLGGGSTVTVPALGVPADGLTLIHGWRGSDGSASLGLLARRLRPPGPLRVAGPTLPSSAGWLEVRAKAANSALSVTADLRGPGGAVRQLPLGIAGPQPRFLRARLPSGRWELEALELDEPSGVEATNGHQNAENPAPPPHTPAVITLGPMTAISHTHERVVRSGLAGWRGVGSATPARRQSGASAVTVSFTPSGEPGLVRPEQPSDSRPTPVLVDTRTAAAAGPRGRLPLTVDGLPVLARVVGVLRRFPTLPANAGGFVIADEATLASALDAQLPGQGQADELWISTRHLRAFRKATRRAPFAQLAFSFRTDAERAFRNAPLARGVLGTLIASAAVTAVLAIVGLLTALMGAARDRELEEDLLAQGVGPAALRFELRARATAAGIGGVCAGLVLGLLLVRLAVAAVRTGAWLAHPRPPLVTVVPWPELMALGAGMAVLLAAAGALASWERR